MSGPRRTDAPIAAALAAAAIVEGALLDGLSAAVLVRALVCLPVAWRRTAPVASVVASAMGILAVTVLGASVDTTIPVAAFVLCLFSFGVRADRRQLLRIAPAVVVLTEAAVLLGDEPARAANAAFTAVVFIALPLAAARLVRSRTELARRLAAQAEALEAEREVHAARAVTDERARMAADLHGIVAAGVRAMLDEVSVAERCTGSDGERCAAAIAAVEDRGRETLVEMRRLLGVLRQEDEDLALAPQPSLARVGALAEQLRRSERPIAVHVEGDAHDLSPGLDIAAYRILEEALEAAGDTATTVVVRWADRHLHLEVACDGPALADGSRLGPTRERVELFGGRARTGRRPRGGSALAVELPTHEASVAA